MCPLFLLNFYFSPNDNLSKTGKCFLFDLKSSFCSRNIQIFVFSSSPLFFPVCHCFRGWSKKNLEAYDIINCLNKNLITHLVWYVVKEISYDIETLAIDRGLSKEHFLWKNHTENVHQKLAPDPFLILLNNPKQPLHEIPLKIRYSERGLLTLVFFSEPSPF